MEDPKDDERYLRRLKTSRVIKRVRKIFLAIASVALEIIGIIITLWPVLKTGKENLLGIPVAFVGFVFMFIYYYYDNTI